MVVSSQSLILGFSALPTFRLLSFPPTDGPGVRLIWVAAGSRHYQECGQLPTNHQDHLALVSFDSAALFFQFLGG